jgi:hypothetical protein
MSHTGVRAFALGSIAMASLMGVLGRRRTDFMSDFTYNKYHFGVAVQVASALGVMQCIKLRQPA